ncbi:MAG: zinc ribbon domain-containing protein [Chloroflexota bacterium]|nr:MAG: zinc ribbon domain-containing protein [Chloroflexota bacterium]
MPIYEYHCPCCDLDFERLRPLSAADQSAACPKCQSESRRRVSQFASFSRGSSGELSAVGGGGSNCGGCSGSSCSTCH